MGEDEYGHPKYDTLRTEIGELIYQLKYNSKINAINDIMNIIKPYLDQWNISDKIDIIIPVPPSKGRRVQPVFLIAKEIARYLNIPINTQVIKKINTKQLKDVSSQDKISNINSSIVKEKHFIKKVNILLIDDLYDSGATLTEIVNVLRTDDNIYKIYVLTMTKTKGG